MLGACDRNKWGSAIKLMVMHAWILAAASDCVGASIPPSCASPPLYLKDKAYPTPLHACGPGAPSSLCAIKYRTVMEMLLQLSLNTRVVLGTCCTT